MNQAVRLAREGWFVTLGIPPKNPETGYGYIHSGQPRGDGAFVVAGFTEMPDLATAEKQLASGDYYWSACGFFVLMFFWAAVASYAL